MDKRSGNTRRKFMKQTERLNPVKSVGSQLFLIFLSSIVVVVLSLGIASYTKARNTLKDHAAEANRQTIIQLSEKMDILLNQYEKMAVQLFFDPQFQADLTLFHAALTPAEQFVAMTSLNQKLATQSVSDSRIVSISLVPDDDSKEIIRDGGSKLVDEDVRTQEWFRQILLHQNQYQPVYAGDSSTYEYSWFPASLASEDNSNIVYVQSLENMGDSAHYTIMIEIKNDLLHDSFQNVELGLGSNIQLVSENGMVVASSVPEEERKISQYTFILDSASNVSSMETTGPDGEELLAVFSVLDKADWKLAGTIPTSQLVSTASSILSTAYIAAGGAVLLAILIGIWMVRSIARPLVRLKNLMEEGAKGNLLVRAEYSSDNEIGQLSFSFNRMMDQLADLVSQTAEIAGEVLDTAGKLGQASRHTADSAEDIAVSTQQIASGAEGLAREAERGSELTELITRKLAVVIESNERMDRAARKVGDSSVKGVTQLEQLLAINGRTGEDIQTLSLKMYRLKETAFSAMKMLDLMKSITQQTNILSLNAGIEAARAGEAGQGFRVVADEIRGLAHQSKESIAVVTQIAESIMNETNEAIAALAGFVPQFEDQTAFVNGTSELFISVQQQMDAFIESLGQVTESIQGLSQSQNTLTESMNSVSAVAEQSSATSEEVASISSEQQTVSSQLLSLTMTLENVSSRLKHKLSLFKM